MFYRVDYYLALLAAGSIAAAVFARRVARVEPSLLADRYLLGTAVLTAIAVVNFVSFYGLGVPILPLALAAASGDLGTIVFGFLIGIAAVHLWRGGFADFLRAPKVPCSRLDGRAES